MARGDFQDNAISLTQPLSLSGLGNDVLAAVSGADMLAPDALDKAVNDAIAQDIIGADNDTLLGVSSGSIESSNRLELFNRQLRERLVREARAKSANHDLLLLDAYMNGRIGEFIAGEVFDDMSDAEIEDCVTDIEQSTGQSFDDYAKDKLGDEMPERRMGESDADYHRRVLKAVTEEMIDPVTGKIKAQYADDPLADIVRKNDGYRDTLGRVETHLAEAKEQGVDEDLAIEIQNEARKNYKTAATMNNASNVEDIDVIVSQEQDVQRDVDANGQTVAGLNDDFLAMTAMSEEGSGQVTDPLDKIQQASADARLEFNTQSAPPKIVEAENTPSKAHSHMSAPNLQDI